ncbi:MAG: hypothetical protein WB511_09870 [Nitrososphaeraceae archaeon]
MDSRRPIYNLINMIYMPVIVQQLVCDYCKRVIWEKEGEDLLNLGEFPISEIEAEMINREHRGHECHIEAVEKQP